LVDERYDIMSYNKRGINQVFKNINLSILRSFYSELFIAKVSISNFPANPLLIFLGVQLGLQQNPFLPVWRTDCKVVLLENRRLEGFIFLTKAIPVLRNYVPI